MFSTRDRLLLALARAPQRTASGADLARRLGLTRTAVWKQINALKVEGLSIKTRHANGYQLSTPYDVSLLEGPFSQKAGFWKAHYQFSVTSTQTLAKQAAETGTPEGHYWLSEKQTAGRGRLERTWDSAIGGLWFSLLLRPDISPALVPSLTLVVSLALAESIRELTHVQARLKWPNDVVVETPGGWRKVAGILTELSAEVDRTRWVVVGIGVNANNVLDPSLARRATTLSDLCGRLIVRADILSAFLNRLGKAYRRFEKSGFEAFRKPYWQLYSRPNAAVQLKTSQGVVSGVARGVDARGALVVESQKQIQSIWEGEIVL